MKKAHILLTILLLAPLAALHAVVAPISITDMRTEDVAQPIGIEICYLPENWHAYASLFAGHYGMAFDESGYRLEPWLPLKGQRVRCGLPVMGKVQETME